MVDARRLVFATRNKGKLVELRDLLRGGGWDAVTVLSLDDAAPGIADVVEDRDTFRGNAEKKAREISEATGLPALADDSGLEVDALGGAPGVYSARYAGDGHDDRANLAKLQVAMVGQAVRTARFRACLVLADVRGALGEARVIVADGVCEGTILDGEPRGSHGFGYDPLFVDPETGRTFGELPMAVKSERSHRARAMRAIEPELRAYLLGR